MLANISVGFTKAVFVHGGHSSAEVQKSAGKCLADDSARIPTDGFEGFRCDLEGGCLAADPIQFQGQFIPRERPRSLLAKQSVAWL
jgi:hypothetical protein